MGTEAQNVCEAVKATKTRVELTALWHKHKDLAEDPDVKAAFVEASARLPKLTEERAQAPVEVNPNFRPSGIAGLDGNAKEPFGAVLTVGHKGPRGNPTDTDRFFIVVPQMADNVRALHPAFTAFNTAPAAERQVIRGHLVHATEKECFQHNLRAQVLPKPHPTHPHKAPACSGDGVQAQRWDGQRFNVIKCPNELCSFRQAPQSGPTPCKPWLQFAFRPAWDNPLLPRPLIKLTSGSWNSTKSFVGFFRFIEKQAQQLGVPDVNLYGLPFTITLSKKSVPQQQRAFPVLSISPDGDVQEFLYRQVKQRRELREERLPAVAALTDGSERDPEVEHADLVTINPGLGTPREVTVTTTP